MTDQGRDAGAGQWSDLLLVLLKRRRFIFWNTFIVTSLTLAATFIMTPRFTATATILPPQDENEGLFSLGNLMQRFDLSQLMPGAASSAKLYVAILKSRSVADSVVSEFRLIDRYQVKTRDKASRKLRGRSKFQINSSGVIKVSVWDHDREMAADLANELVSELDRINRDLRSGEGKRTRTFVEERLQDTQERLRAAEDSLLAFQQRHPGIALPAEVMSAASAGADLMARRVALGYELELKRSTLQPGAAPLLRKEAEVRALDRELENLPVLTVEMGRRLRDFKVQEKVFELLSAQYETALIQERKNTSTVQVLDPAIPPARRSFPRRGLLTLTAMFVSFAIGLLVVAFLEATERLRPAEDPRLRAHIRPGSLLDRILFARLDRSRGT
jgi:uncharacterized protein involved in exopolysaccharide biosynthesis